jgi:hypothetical protein
MRKLQKQFGNRADPRQYVRLRNLFHLFIDFYFSKQQTKQRDPSVRVRDDWQVIEEIPFSTLTKFSLPNISEPEEL